MSCPSEQRAYETPFYAALVDELGDPYLDPLPLPVREVNRCEPDDAPAEETETP